MLRVIRGGDCREEEARVGCGDVTWVGRLVFWSQNDRIFDG